MANPRRRAIAAAGSVVCAAVVGVLASELAGRWTWGLVAALVAAVLLWAGIEAWRAVREKDAGGLAQGGIGVRQRARRVAGRLTGMRGPVAGKRTGIAVDQEVGTISEGGSVIGVDADRPAPGQSAGSGGAPPG